MILPIEVIEAVVQVGSEETSYLRCGRGAGTVVLLTASAEVRLRHALRLAEQARVIAPLLPARAIGAGEYAAGPWLARVAEGLGLERPRVVLTADLAAWVPSLAEAGPTFGTIEVLATDAGP